MENETETAFDKIVRALDAIADDEGTIQADPHAAAVEVAAALGIEADDA